MLIRLIILFPLVTLIELALLFWIADRTDWLFTICLVIVTGVVGASLAHHEGLRCWTDARRRMERGELPADSLLDGLLILLAAAVLITPGVLTDLVGFSLLIPLIRRFFRRWLTERFRAKLFVTPPPGGPWEESHDEIIDVRVIDGESNRPEKG